MKRINIFIKVIILNLLLIISIIFIINLTKDKKINASNKNNTNNINTDINRIDENNDDYFIHYDINTDIDSDINSNNNTYQEVTQNVDASPVGNKIPTFSLYKKGNSEVNIIFNFVNYDNDTTHILTETEINSKMQDIKTNLNYYWNTQSMGKMTINCDYICSIAPLSYQEYLAKKTASYSIENDIFVNALNNSNKEFSFVTYQIKVNVFAGNTGSWNTFLWPHAYSGSGMIMLVESNMRTSTLCHELGHTFGAPDLYAYTGSQIYACGFLDIMGDGYNFETMNAYTRSKIGFLETSDYEDEITSSIETIKDTKDEYNNLKLYPSCINDKTKTIAYKFGEYYYDNHKEFFVVEYRKKNYQSFFDPGLTNDCVIVYRVNQRSSGNTNGNKDGFYAEIIYMGNQSIDISNNNYLKSCQVSLNSSIGGNDTNNYKLSYTASTGKANLFKGVNTSIVVTFSNVTNEYAEINIKFPDKQLIEDNTIHFDQTLFTYNGDYQCPKIILTTSLVTYTTSGDEYEDGTFTVKYNFIYDSVHYRISSKFKEFESCEYTILPYKLTLKPIDYVGIYDKLDHRSSLFFEAVDGEFFFDDIDYVDYSIDVIDYSINAGVYTIKLQAELSGYQFTILDGTYTINPIDINVKINNQTSIYNQELEPLSYEITKGNILTGDKLDIRLTKNEGLDVGTYQVTGVNLNSNYNVIFSNGKYIITQAKLNTWCEDTTYTFDNDYHFINYKILTEGNFKVSYGNKVDNVSRDNYQDDLFKNACDQMECFVIIFGGKNYESTIITAKLTIKKALINAESYDTTYTFDNDYHFIDYQINTNLYDYNLYYGTSIDDINNKSYDNYHSLNLKNVCSNQLCYLLIDAGTNYEPLIISNYLNIKPAEINAEATNNIVDYDGKYHFINYQINNLKNYQIYYGFDKTNINLSDYHLDSCLNVCKDLECYILIDGGNNYIPKILSGYLTINPIEIDISVSDKIVTYDGDYHFIDYHINSKLANYQIYYGTDINNINLTTINHDCFKNTCDNLNCFILIDAGTNYKTKTISAKLTINKAKINGFVVSNSKTVTYDGYYHFIDYYVTNLKAYNIKYGTDINNINYNNINQECFKNVCENLDCYLLIEDLNNNYEPLILSGKLTINKANINKDWCYAVNTTVTYDDDFHFVDYYITHLSSYVIYYGTDKNNITKSSYHEECFKNVCSNQTCYILIDAGMNYNPLILSASLTISPADIDASVSSLSTTYDGDYHIGELKINNIDSYTIKYGYNKNNIIYDNYELNYFKEVGSNKEYYILIDGGSNYSPRLLTSTISINPINITINIHDKTTYLDNIDNDYQYDIIGNIIDNPNVSFECLVQNKVGTYEIKGIDNDPIYNITFNNGKYSIIDYPTYKITYKLNGGINNINNPNSYSYKNESELIEILPATKFNNKFIGWKDINTNEIITEINTSIQKDIVLLALYEKNKTSNCKNNNIIISLLFSFMIIGIIYLKNKNN